MEVYTNTTELWRKTQSSLHQMPRPLLVTEKGTFRLENYTAEKEEKKEHSLISQLKEWLHEVFHLTKDKVQETTAGQNEDEKDLDVSLYELLDIYSKVSNYIYCTCTMTRKERGPDTPYFIRMVYLPTTYIA